MVCLKGLFRNTTVPRFINHVVSFLNCGYRIFAEDIKLQLYLSYNGSHAQTRSSLQRDIDLLASTSSSGGFNINASKCAVIRFAHRSSSLPFTGQSPYIVNNPDITFTTSHSDLGLSTDRSLKFQNHIRSKVTSVIALTTNFLDPCKTYNGIRLVDLEH